MEPYVEEAASRTVGAGVIASDILLDPCFPYGEEFLQFIWEAGLYDAERLCTTDGRPLEVLHAGRVQHGSGPDLKDARIRIGDQLWAGNVEVHRRASEWNAHGHQSDPAYNNVVLHAVYLHDADVRTAEGNSPPTVELRTRLNEANLALHHRLMRDEGWVPCAKDLHRVPQDRVRLWLGRLMVERLERKTLEVEALYKRLGNDPGETFHHMLLRGFGFKVNTEACAMLANALPGKLLDRYRGDALRTEALLFGQAGFLEEEFKDDHPRRWQTEYRVLAHLHGLRPIPVVAWKTGRMRPSNFPTVRLAQLAALTEARPDLLQCMTEEDDPVRIINALNVEAGSYWKDHYSFDRPSAARPKRLGATAAAGLVINTVVPYLFAMGRIRGHQPSMDRALELLEHLPPERNAVIDGWAGSGIVADHAAMGQALIELKDRYCSERRCLFCAIGTRLHKCCDPARTTT
jgi:hypothetical protein